MDAWRNPKIDPKEIYDPKHKKEHSYEKAAELINSIDSGVFPYYQLARY